MGHHATKRSLPARRPERCYPRSVTDLSRLSPLLALVGLLGCRVVPSAIEQSEAATAPELLAPEREPEARVLSCGPEVLAIIHDEARPMTGFDMLFSLELLKYKDRGREIPPSAARRYRKSISERLIYQRLLELETAELGLSYDPDALAERERMNQHGIDDWAEHLRRRGESEASLRAMYIAELRERALLEARGALSPSAADIEAEYEKVAPDYDRDVDRVRASHILIKVDPDRPGRATRAEAEAEAKRILAEARAPDADFAELARRESDGPSARRGGELGLFTADRMVENFSKPVFKAAPGDVLLTETKYGFHVVFVAGHYGPGRLPLPALEPEIRGRLEARKLHEGRVALEAELWNRYAPRNCELERLEAEDAASTERPQ